MHRVPQLGVGIQYNPEILHWFPFEEQRVDVFEVLLDNLIGPIDGPMVLQPGKLELIQQLRSQHVLIAHSNYGGEFGFGPLEESVAVRRHVSLARMMESPWVSDHCFYADDSWMDIWSSPLQFSRAEVARIAARARKLQELYGIPLGHENAAYYVACPGGEMSEAEFLARLVDAAGTWLHLDLHNVYTNSVNHPGYSAEAFLKTIPLDRVISIHLAGGSWSGGFYHDWHDSKVPEPVWEMLEQVLEKSRPGAVILEFQGRAHHANTRVLSQEEDLQLIQSDLKRAQALWDRVYGPGSRRGTREHTHGG
ncbi:DUF692 family protein [Corallococcus exercitus]|uniref:DUF692 family protein n=1 Tax=Corallococcus exercitus TaxID=2316736 RepID=A0A7Y4KIG5_9BACT|nr:DUF692 family multinuclear iron-containing protein [Corallococcus exercitus]NOK33334.1 DUF692 family protein [Corallococcus exercitus]